MRSQGQPGWGWLHEWAVGRGGVVGGDRRGRGHLTSGGQRRGARRGGVVGGHVMFRYNRRVRRIGTHRRAGLSGGGRGRGERGGGGRERGERGSRMWGWG